MPRFSWNIAAAVALTALSLHAQSIGPDVIVGDLPNVSNYGSSGSIAAFAVGTTSCNIGNQTLNWFANVNQHPVIGQNMYRLRNGQFELIGISWLKHGFTALAGSVCSTCQNPGTGTLLGIGCSDPYSSSLNGGQSGLGPRFEVNANTGAYPYPYTSPAFSGNIARRLQVKHADLDPTLNVGASYFVEGHYVTPDDAAAGNQNNNASYRPANITPNAGSYNLSLTGSTVREKPAIFAWATADPSVQLVAADVPGEGRFWVGFKATDLGNGTFSYEYAVHNLNSDRSAGSFSVPLPANATVSGIGFHDVDYHSGEPFSGLDWTANQAGGFLTWSTTPFATDPNANALRWGTLYNFRFTSDMAPGNPVIGLFKPGSPASVTVPVGPPAFAISLPNGVPAQVPANQAATVAVQVTDLAGQHDAASAQVFVRVDGGPFTSTPLTGLGNGAFLASLPAAPCYSVIEWYLSIDAIGGGTILSPDNAPASLHRTESGLLVTLFSDDFQTDKGWTVFNEANLTDGPWERGVPVGGGVRGDPAVDADGSGACYLTDNVAGNSDVDGGATRLISPIFDLAGLGDAVIRYQYWWSTNFGGQNVPEAFIVEISNNGGTSWTLVDSDPTETQGWDEKSFHVASYVTLTSSIRLRFTAQDTGTAQVIEAGLDDFSIEVCSLMDETLAAGNVGVNGGGGPHDVLLVNGGNGGGLRRVSIGVNQPMSFDMLQIPTNPFPSLFAVYGSFGVPTPLSAYAIGFGIGTMVITPCPANPLDTNLFVFTDNFGAPSPCAGIIGSTPTPWSFTYAPGLPFPLEFTLQPVAVDPTGAFSLAIGNAVIVRVTP